MISQIAIRTLAGAAERGELPEDVQSGILKRVREAVASMDSTAQKRLLEEVGVESLTDSAALKILMGGGGLAGLGIAVELSGFAAYILAAQASAIIPFVGGKTLVSTLAVVSNPVFILPVLALGGGALSRSTLRSLRSAFGPTAVATLVLNALSHEETDAGPLLEIFRNLPTHLPSSEVSDWHERRREASVQNQDWTTVGRRLAAHALHWSSKQVWAEPFPRAAEYLDLFERLGGDAS